MPADHQCDEPTPEEDDARREALIDAVAHELRGPLSTMVVGAALLSSRIDDPSLQRVAGRIARSGKRMAAMISDLVDLAHVRLDGGMHIHRRAGHVGAIARACVQEMASRHPTRELRVQTCGELVGEWDVDRLAQMLANLVGNGVFHGDPGGPVAVSVIGEGANVTITVRNRGVIPEEARASLFDPLRERRIGARAAEGLGIGLFIVEQIVVAHGGSVTSECADGWTTFTVELPRAA